MLAGSVGTQGPERYRWHKGHWGLLGGVGAIRGHQGCIGGWQGV